MSFALGFLKPDCLRRGLEDKVYGIIESNGLRIVFKKRLRLTFSEAKELYRDWRHMPFYEDLCKFISSGDIEVFIAEGNDAINILQRLVGGHEFRQDSSTIRGRFATSIRENIIHSTSNEQTFIRESILLIGESAKKWIKPD